jgi:hypothetical protein
MSTYGKRTRRLVNISVSIERSFDDFDPGSVADQVNEPALHIRVNRFGMKIEKRPHRWMVSVIDRTFVMVGTPWCFVGIDIESKIPGADYGYSGDWSEEYHDQLVR